MKAAESISDGKFSLASLDPGTGGLFSLGTLWNGFIVGLILFFIWSIIDQMAKSKQAELDEAELDKLQKRLEGKAD